MSETNKALTQRFIDEIFNQGNLASLDELIADDFVDRTPMPNVPANKEGLKQIALMFRAAFPDLKVTVEQQIAEGDLVAMRLVTRGTHRGDLMGIAATGKQIEINEQHIIRIANGKAVEHWGVEDNLGMMQQLGVVQMPS